MIVFGGRVFGRLLGLDEVMRVELLRWISALTRKRRDQSFLSLGQVKVQQEGSHLQARKRALIKNLTMLAPGLGLSASRTVRNECVMFKPPSLWYFVPVARAKTVIGTSKYSAAVTDI